jgi:membrane protein DedA with SNARE-associated domain
VIDRLVTGISAWIVAVIAAMGYGGIVLLMAIESACIPLPSEVIMPFSGYLVAIGRFNLSLVAVAGAFGCLLGSGVGYYLGAIGGRWVLERYGRYVLIAPHELETAEQFFERWGAPAVFFSRLLPVVRTFIAFPAGVARMRLLPFALYTLAGSYLWCFGLAYAGKQLGQHWSVLGPYFHRFDGLVALATFAAGSWLIYHRLRKRSAADSPSSRVLKKSSQPASPSVVSPASGRELKE